MPDKMSCSDLRSSLRSPAIAISIVNANARHLLGRHVASRTFLFWIAPLFLALTSSRAEVSQNNAKINISAQVTWSSNLSWSKDYTDSDGKSQSMSIEGSETITLSNNLRFELRDGGWELIEGTPIISVGGGAVFKATGERPFEARVTSVAKDPTPSSPMAQIRSLDFAKGHVVLTVTKPETTSEPECMECGLIAVYALFDCMGAISPDDPNPRPQQYLLEFPPVENKEFTVDRGFSWSDPSECGSESIDANLTFSYTPGKWEAVIVPPPDFEDWLPAGGIDGDTPGSSIVVNVQLRYKGQKEPAADLAGAFFVRLENVSRQPGVCVNAPPKDKANTDPDLRLVESDALWISDNDGLRGMSNEDTNELTFEIECFDFGAYGRLRVEVAVEGGPRLKARLESDPGKDYLDIPVDDDGNRIADAWERQTGITPGLPPTWDEAALPAGQSTLGDGISLYEKYRGFFVKGNHRRLDPHRKHLFIYDPTGWAELSSLDPDGVNFVKVLDCEVLFINNTQWTGPGGSGAKKRVVNFNSTDELRATHQHGLHVRFPFTESPTYPTDYSDMLKAKEGTDPPPVITSLGTAYPDLTTDASSSPAGWLAVEVYASNIDKWSREAALWHTYGLPEFAHYKSPATTAAEKARLDALAKKLCDEYITANYTSFEERNWRVFTAVLAHEVAHGLGVDDLKSPGFFGPMECVMRYFPWAKKRAPEDRFELAARIPWPHIICNSPVGTTEGIACWRQIGISDRDGASKAPAIAGLSSFEKMARQPASSLRAPIGFGMGDSGTTRMVKPPHLALSAELLWDDLLDGDPLRIAIHLSSSAYTEALAQSKESGQPLPETVFQPTVAADWHKKLNFWLWRRVGDSYTDLLRDRNWQTFLRPEAVSPRSFRSNPLTHSREWLVPGDVMALEPGEYSLSVFWTGDEMVEPEALPANGFVSSPSIRFQVSARTNALQNALAAHRLAYASYAAGDHRLALDHALSALAQTDARKTLAVEGTHMIAANAAIKLQEYRTAAVLSRDLSQSGLGELAETAYWLNRALAPEILLGPDPGRNNALPLIIVALPGYNYEVQSSHDLLHWSMLDRRFATASRYEVRDTWEGAQPMRFYRVVWLP
jgi:hypothetical protein